MQSLLDFCHACDDASNSFLATYVLIERWQRLLPDDDCETFFTFHDMLSLAERNELKVVDLRAAICDTCRHLEAFRDACEQIADANEEARRFIQEVSKQLRPITWAVQALREDSQPGQCHQLAFTIHKGTPEPARVCGLLSDARNTIDQLRRSGRDQMPRYEVEMMAGAELALLLDVNPRTFNSWAGKHIFPESTGGKKHIYAVVETLGRIQKATKTRVIRKPNGLDAMLNRYGSSMDRAAIEH